MADNGYTSSDIDYSDFYSGALDPYKPYVQTPGAMPYNTSLPLSTDRPSGGLISRSVTTVPIDGYGNPILQQQKQDAVARALSIGGGGSGSLGARADVAAALDARFGTGPSGNRLTPMASGYGASGPTLMSGWGGVPFGYSGSGKPSSALGAIDAVTASAVPLPRARPNIEANPGVNIPIRGTDTGLLGIPMSAGMNRNLAARAAVSGIPGLVQRAPMGSQPANITVRGGNRTQQALAQVAASQPAPMYQSNGVANPAYRDYSGSNTSSGGGIAPSSSPGTFTDSLGGVYRDRNL